MKSLETRANMEYQKYEDSIFTCIYKWNKIKQYLIETEHYESVMEAYFTAEMFHDNIEKEYLKDGYRAKSILRDVKELIYDPRRERPN